MKADTSARPWRGRGVQSVPSGDAFALRGRWTEGHAAATDDAFAGARTDGRPERRHGAMVRAEYTVLMRQDLEPVEAAGT